ncbi:MAG: NUDIX hydrolase [Saprospiraceae bacterium]
MYKIYINDNPLFLIANGELASLRSQHPGCLTGRYTGQLKTILHYVDLLEKSRLPRTVVLHSADPEGLVRDFFSQFHYLEAAGGLVFNPEGKALFIFRRGRWDLPKGKADPGETPPETALREVREETGVEQLELKNHIADTLHTYREKGRRILKRTYWYAMETTDTRLVPQAEEDIEKADWVEINETFLRLPEIYPSILEVVRTWMRG